MVRDEGLRRARPPLLVLSRARTGSLSTNVVFREEAELYGHSRQERAFVVPGATRGHTAVRCAVLTHRWECGTVFTASIAHILCASPLPRREDQHCRLEVGLSFLWRTRGERGCEGCARFTFQSNTLPQECDARARMIEGITCLHSRTTMPMDTTVLFATIQKRCSRNANWNAMCLLCCGTRSQQSSFRSGKSSVLTVREESCQWTGVCAGSSYRVT